MDEAAIRVQLALTENVILETSNEIGRLEKFTDRILAKLSSVITLSSILTFLSFAFVGGDSTDTLIRYYMLWVLPFLIAGVACWILVLKRSAGTSMKQLSVVQSDNPEVQLQYLHARFQMYQQLHMSTHAIYQESRKLFSISLGLILIYLASFLITVYLFVFTKELPSLVETVLGLIIMLLLGFLFQQWYSKPKPAVQVDAPIRVPAAPDTAKTRHQAS